MGQQNSTNLHSRSARGGVASQQAPPPAKAPPPRPPSPPPVPKVPNYAVPENRVLPLGAMEVPDKRHLLRPVSQELSKFHPDFADIFNYQGEEGLSSADAGEGEDGKENMMSNGMTSLGHSRSTGSLDNDRLISSMYPKPTANGDIGNKASTMELTRTHSLQEKRSNGHVMSNGHAIPNGHAMMNGHVSTNPNGSDVTDRGRTGRAVQRTNSLDRMSQSNGAKVRAHKRFPSASTSLANEASVIPEDPREHLYTHWRQDPFSNPTPAVTSLPLKNTFQLDYKMNLTYAQLAEHRRQQRVADLEEKTGKKLSDLNADLKDQSTVPVSPFDRNNYTPSVPSAGSATGSSDTGVSKSKKRRAPPPPSSGPGQGRDSSPGRLSLDVEPPADYDMDDPSPPLNTAPSPWKPNLSRQSSNASSMSALSKNSKGQAPKVPPAPPAPPPFPQSAAPVSKGATTSSASSLSPQGGAAPPSAASPLGPTSSRLIAEAKAELEALKKLELMLKEKDHAGKEQGEEAAGETAVGDSQGQSKNLSEGEGQRRDDVVRGNDDVTKEEEATSKDTGEAVDGKASPMSVSSSTSDIATTTTTTTAAKLDSDGSNSPRRLNSLLQHDIMLAAQAMGAKGQVKAKTPVQAPKPKDPAQLFREELAKAATAREERAKSAEAGKKHEGEGNEQDSDLVFKSDLVRVKRKAATSEVVPASPSSADKGEVSESKPSSPPPVLPKPTSPLERRDTESRVALSKSEGDLLSAQADLSTPSHASRQRPAEGYPDLSASSPLRKAVSHDGVLDLSDDDDSHALPSSSPHHHHTSSSSTQQYGQDWKPEDDLDTDDDMNDDLTYSRSSAALQASDGFKSSIIPSKVDDLKSAKRKSSSFTKSGRRESAGSSSTDEKNKFGSIRKFQRSVHKGVRQAFGSISKASGKLLRRNKSHDFDTEGVQGQKYRVTTEDDDPTASQLHQHMNGDLDSDEHEDDAPNDEADGPAASEDKQVRKMKRAGVAYVSKKGQIVVLPDYETVQLDEDGNVVDDKADEDEGRAPRIFRKKKKKFTYESTVRRQEKDRAAEQYALEARLKEDQMELERLRQQDMDREFQRLRDLETQERLQRLQTAQLQQQMNLLQHQHQLSSLQLGQPATLSHAAHPQQRYSVGQLPGQGLYTAGVTGTLPPVNMSSYTVHSAPFVAPASTAATTAAVGGYDVNYLSNYMRMMGVQPPVSQQQWAYLLTSVQQVHPPTSLFDSTQSKAQGLLMGPSAGPDLSHLFPAKTPSPYTDTSALVAQKASLMNLLGAGHSLPQALPAEASLPSAGPDLTAVVPQRAPASSSTSSSSSSRPKSVAVMSSEGQVNGVAERSNPVYNSEDEEEKNRDAPSASVTASRAGSGKDRRRPQSAALPVTVQSNIYRDVTSREEAGVTRVHVPDYRQNGGHMYADENIDDSDDDDAVEEEGPVDVAAGANATVAFGEEEEEEEGENGFRTVQFHSQGKVGARHSSALPPKVYGPLGYKPVAFTSSSHHSSSKQAVAPPVNR